MNEHKPGGGGAANTPPFPRLVERAEGPREGGPRAARIDSVPEPLRPPLNQPGAAEAYHSDPRAHTAPAGARPLGKRERPLPSYRSLAEDPGPTDPHLATAGATPFGRMAERIDRAADRIEQIAESRLHGDGTRGRAGDIAHSTAGAMGDLAEYLRSSEVQTVRADLERTVRERPVPSLLIALGAGWVLGKILR
jgi:hypothetical protein